MGYKIGLPGVRAISTYSEWKSWDHFFDRSVTNFESLQRVALENGIISSLVYSVKAKSLGLPGRQCLKNMPEWQGWDHFLGR